MSKPVAIKARGVKKRYRLGATASPDTLRDAVSALIPGRPDAAKRGQAKREASEFWALKGIDFDVSRGECLGIIGHNGAGKSTLLKILARITEPTTGRIEMQGRVAALLEVGTGFHPELTGRENAMLNGSILGMSRKEVKAKLADIVEFAGTEKFMDTPVKRYSSGMRVRLGFAVAAHLDPDILIVDEVLAVGDAQFQNRSLGRMNDVIQSGRVVIFVSHQLQLVAKLCNRVMCLREGEVEAIGEPDQVLAHYTSAAFSGHRSLQDCRVGNSRLIETVHLNDQAMPRGLVVGCGDSLEIKASLRGPASPQGLFGLTISFVGPQQEKILTLSSYRSPLNPMSLDKPTTLTCIVPRLGLLPGEYRVDLSCGSAGKSLDRLEGIAVLTVLPGDIQWYGRHPNAGEHGYFYQDADWAYAEPSE